MRRRRSPASVQVSAWLFFARCGSDGGLSARRGGAPAPIEAPGVTWTGVLDLDPTGMLCVLPLTDSLWPKVLCPSLPPLACHDCP